jgi:1-acyl-sn-glycerol-3-phosphate acyltransferase
MIFIRSLAFNVAFYLSLIVQMIALTPIYFLTERKKAWFVPKNWARSNLWLQKVIVGCDHEIEGLEHIPDTACIIAPKHQSFWDAYAFVPRVPDPVYILKRELMWIPLFGWYVGKMKMIPVHRGSRAVALKSITDGARRTIADNRQIMIYPEGTRRAPGDEPSYKFGVAHLYAELRLPVIPIAHMAGLYWPRRRFMRYPGIIKCRVLPPILPGLSKVEFLKELQRVTEAACDEFLIEAATGPNPCRNELCDGLEPVVADAYLLEMRQRVEHIFLVRPCRAARAADNLCGFLRAEMPGELFIFLVRDEGQRLGPAPVLGADGKPQVAVDIVHHLALKQVLRDRRLVARRHAERHADA